MKISDLSAFAAAKIRATPSKVCNAFVNADEMGSYWLTRHDSELKEGETSRWSLGADPNAFSFDVHVKELSFPDKLVIDWPGDDGGLRQVTWLFKELDDGGTSLSIEETGFTGSDEQIIASVLDSTRGFNQVIIAVKAFVEHGVRMNVVADHV